MARPPAGVLLMSSSLDLTWTPTTAGLTLSTMSAKPTGAGIPIAFTSAATAIDPSCAIDAVSHAEIATATTANLCSPSTKTELSRVIWERVFHLAVLPRYDPPVYLAQVKGG